MKRPELTLRENLFSGEDPILILEFVPRFGDEADILEMNEAQVLIALPHLLNGEAADQFRSVKTACSSLSSEGFFI